MDYYLTIKAIAIGKKKGYVFFMLGNVAFNLPLYKHKLYVEKEPQLKTLHTN